MKLERLLKRWGNWGRREVREQLFSRAVRVNGEVVDEAARLIGPFDRVECGEEVVQNRVPRYVMLHKPLGVVSATADEEHPTVIDLVAENPWAQELHLAGRLDRFTTGLMILTNDSDFSELLTEPQSQLGKRYRVGCDSEVSAEIITAFEEGIWFAKEGVKTQSAQVELLSEKECLLTIFEGKHHQVKRMFALFGVKVLTLHREAMGALELEPELRPGQWRPLSDEEICSVLKSPEVRGGEIETSG